ncbi:MAG TPA: putative porin [Verrucomicrobiae bacterium]|nr:putative porin [Verrucomicrobiae bacterium]
MTINLINRLVERGVLSPEDARELIQQAEHDAAEARAQAAKTTTEQLTNDTVGVRYVPEIVKAQIRDEIEGDVMKQARIEHWAATNSLPAWVYSFYVFGDIRVRYEEDLFPKGNDDSGVFPNFNAINTGSPFDTTGPDFSPQRNVDQDRSRMRLRARLGTEINLQDGYTAGLRLATGEDDQPVSANQSLGAAGQGQGGDFSKYAIWLDRAFIKYEMGGSPNENLAISAGRFDNPFFSTSIIWEDNIGFDGLALRGREEIFQGVTAFAAGGAFPIFNTDFNFSSDRPDKFPSEDKWLYAGQLGIDWKIKDDLSFKGAGAYYYFYHAEGRLSSPFVPLTTADHGNTDDTRPSFAQYGNTYMALRDITPVAANDFGTIDQWQYYGLATPFRDVDFTARLDYSHFEPFDISLTGEFIKNVGFDRNRLNDLAVNNVGADTSSGARGPYLGGDTAWIVILKLGKPVLQKRWDWTVRLDYRYVESDSVIDGFCDADFGGGGTNVKGYTIGAAVAIAPRVALGVRWYSSDEVAGPTLKADTLQIDANATF